MIGCRKIKRIYIKVVRLTLLLTVPGFCCNRIYQYYMEVTSFTSGPAYRECFAYKSFYNVPDPPQYPHHLFFLPKSLIQDMTNHFNRNQQASNLISSRLYSFI